MNLYQVIDRLREFAQAYYPLVVLVTSAFTLLLGLKTGLLPKVFEKIRDFWNTDIRLLKTRNAELTGTLKRVRDAFDDDNNLWLRNPVIKPGRCDARLRDRDPILRPANLKGAGGKKTIAANL